VGRIFFSFSPGSQPTMFLLSSQWVPIRLPICSPNSQCVPPHVLHSTSLLSHMLWQMLSSFHLYTWAKGEELYTSKQNLLLWGASTVSFYLSDGPIKLACCQKKIKKLNLGGTSSN
jgi:hypothetical protein